MAGLMDPQTKSKDYIRVTPTSNFIPSLNFTSYQKVSALWAVSALISNPITHTSLLHPTLPSSAPAHLHPITPLDPHSPRPPRDVLAEANAFQGSSRDLCSNHIAISCRFSSFSSSFPFSFTLGRLDAIEEFVVGYEAPAPDDDEDDVVDVDDDDDDDDDDDVDVCTCDEVSGNGEVDVRRIVNDSIPPLPLPFPLPLTTADDGARY
ncbi:hypothetical protein CC80DRAFT_549336 [Byssothecium circinans]|uniref:Uncharacterized protein n=1 Tax=Byssothecium circinans TaxID=147558 RepID=A0A6A5TTL8_9PLEO|nr:hypothetical protein CC80DRAFT_549336 [Byssothecium circinans]